MVYENGSRFWSNIEHDLGKTYVYAELEWYYGWIQKHSVTVIQSMFVRGKNKILTCGADLCPINDVMYQWFLRCLWKPWPSKWCFKNTMHASLFHLQLLLNLCVGLLCANNPLYQTYLCTRRPIWKWFHFSSLHAIRF